jgi:hypothetical protein
MEMASINDRCIALLNDYSGKTGIPIERCVNDALFDWLGNVAPVVLAKCGLPPLDLCRSRPQDITAHSLRR